MKIWLGWIDRWKIELRAESTERRDKTTERRAEGTEHRVGSGQSGVGSEEMVGRIHIPESYGRLPTEDSRLFGAHL